MKRINFTFADGVTKQIDVCESLKELTKRLNIKSIFKSFDMFEKESLSDCYIDQPAEIIKNNINTNIESKYLNNDKETILEFSDCRRNDSDICKVVDVFNGDWFNSTILNEDDDAYAFFEYDGKIYLFLYYTLVL